MKTNVEQDVANAKADLIGKRALWAVTDEPPGAMYHPYLLVAGLFAAGLLFARPAVFTRIAPVLVSVAMRHFFHRVP